MTGRLTVWAGLLLGAAVWAGGGGESAPTAARGVAVVELFTSEGCSSCPPADEVLGRIEEVADAAGDRVYVLGWHVDYWDYLGWRDPWGAPEWSSRQRTYATTLETGVYTPQMIVNGRRVVRHAGSETDARSEIQAALSSPAPVTLELESRLDTGSSVLTVGAHLSGAPSSAILVLAVAESGLGGTPSRGENAGRALRHVGVVRVAESVRATGDPWVTLDLPRDLDPARARLIGLVQDPATLTVLGAAQVRLAMRTGVRGRVVDVSGAALAGIDLQLCGAVVCVPGQTGADGSFRLEAPKAGTYTLRVGASAAPVTLELAPGPDRDLGDIVLRS